MILATWFSVTVEKLKRVWRGGVSSEMCCGVKDTGKVQQIFSILSVKNSSNPSSRS